jgi:hypothetical protein
VEQTEEESNPEPMIENERYVNEEDSLEDLLDPKSYGYILTWICLIQKLNSPLTVSLNFEVIKRAIKRYVEEHKYLA